jgi:hypothetical protein
VTAEAWRDASCVVRRRRHRPRRRGERGGEETFRLPPLAVGVGLPVSAAALVQAVRHRRARRPATAALLLNAATGAPILVLAHLVLEAAGCRG